MGDAWVARAEQSHARSAGGHSLVVGSLDDLLVMHATISDNEAVIPGQGDMIYFVLPVRNRSAVQEKSVIPPAKDPGPRPKMGRAVGYLTGPP